MKATELMIGDWVMFSNSEGGTHTEPHQVNCIDFFNMEVHADGEIYDIYDEHDNPKGAWEILPIQLTAEILEKNQSTTSQIQYCWDDFLSKSFGEDFYEIRYHGDVTELIISIHYVHELQHVLKLCKIEKEIIL